MAQNETHSTGSQGRVSRFLRRVFQPSVEHLLNCLDDGYGFFTTAKDAERKLVKRGAEAVPQLVKALKSSNAHIRPSVVRILGKIGDPATATMIQSLDEDADPRVRQEIFPALLNMGEIGHRILMESHSYYRERFEFESLKSEAKAGSAVARKRLIKKMEHGDIDACVALGDFLEFPEVADALVGKIITLDKGGNPIHNMVSLTAYSILSSMEGQARPALFAALNTVESLSEDADISSVYAAVETEQAVATLLAHNVQNVREAELVWAILTYRNESGRFSKQINSLEEHYPPHLRSGSQKLNSTGNKGFWRRPPPKPSGKRIPPRKLTRVVRG